MDSILDIIVMLIVVALIDVFNKISPYLGFVILIITLIYGILRIIDTYLSIKEKRKRLKE